jgi:hypothetical protein
MNKVYEDILASELADAIDIYWDGSRIKLSHTIEIDNDLFADVNGHIDYEYTREEDTNAIYMTWVSVTIDSMNVEQYEDGELIEKAPHLNEVFVKKYLEQYLLSK